MDILELLNKGGFMMYPLLICSIFTIAIGIERYFYYKLYRIREDVFSAISYHNTDSDYLGSILESKGDKGTLFINSLLWLKNPTRSKIEMMTIVYLYGFKKHLDYLTTIVTLSPLLGLLGTIFGMIDSFSVFNIENGKAIAITGGIGEALIATAFGLIVACIALLIHSYFNNKFNNIVIDTQECVEDLTIKYLENNNDEN